MDTILWLGQLPEKNSQYRNILLMHTFIFRILSFFVLFLAAPLTYLQGQVVYYEEEAPTTKTTEHLEYFSLGQLKGVQPTCSFLSQNKSLFIGSQNGLYIFNGKNFEKAFEGQLLSTPLQSAKINAIDETSEKLLIATGKGLYTINKKSDKIEKQHFDKNAEHPINTTEVIAILVADNNTIWLALENYGIVHLPTLESKPIHYQHETDNESSIASNHVLKLAQDKNSIIWAITENGYLNRFDITTNTFENSRLFQPSNDKPFDVLAFVDFNDQLWIGTSNSGLFTYNILTEEKHQYTYDSLHPNLSNRVNSICKSAYGLWINFSGQPLQLTTNSVYELTEQALSGLSLPKNISTLSVDTDNIYLTSIDGHIGYLTKETELIAPYYPYSSASAPVTSIQNDRFNRVWLGTQNGEIMLRDQSSILLHVSLSNDSLSFNPEYAIEDIEIDELGNLWLATASNGVFLFDPIGEQILKHYSSKPGDSIFGSNQIESLLYLSDGNLLIGSQNGLYQCLSQTDSFNQIAFLSGEKSKDQPSIHDLFWNEDESIWAATSHGIWRRNSKATQFEQVEQLILGNRNFKQILKDSSGVFWFSTQNRLVRFNSRNADVSEFVLPYPFQSSKIVSFAQIGQQQILVMIDEACLVLNTVDKNFTNITPTLENYKILTFYCSQVNNQHKVLASTSHGIFAFKSSKLAAQKPVNPHKPELFALWVNDQKAMPGQKINRKRILKSNLANTRKITLNRRTRSITLHMFTPNELKGDIAYTYQLAGYQDEWQNTPNQIIRFDNLPYGRYTFRCKAISPQLSQSEALTLKIKVRRPIFITWWFILGTLIAFAYYGTKILRQSRDAARGKYYELEKQLQQEKNTLKEREGIFEREKEAFKEREDEEKILRFHANGLAQFSDTLSKNQENIDKLSQVLISQLIEFLEAHQGVVYILNDDDSNNLFLEPKGSFAADFESLKTFLIGEGYVGAAYQKKQLIELNQVPHGYIHVSSGLGDDTPGNILFVPILQNEVCLGIIEISSFEPFVGYKKEFVSKLAENIGSTIAISKSNTAITKMLQLSKQQAEELKSSEEEMRQNLEEMQATQEDLRRQMETNQKMRDDLMKEKALLDAIMNFLPDYIYFKDWDCKFIRISQSMLKLFPVNNIDEMIGKSDFDFQPHEVAKKYYDDEQRIMKSGNALLNDIQHEVFENGLDQWVSTTKMPFYDRNGDCVGIFGITKDITDIKKMEIETKEQNAILVEQEEELRQNLEEMQATQEDLREKMEDNLRMQQSLEKEKALLDALMDNLPEYIYFKDRDCKFIRISQSMLKLFPVETLEEMVGKSDFDFQPRETAQRYYDDEQKIMNSKQGVFDDIAHEVMQNGLEQWVSTTKLPFYNEKGEVIGTFGITKDITNLKLLEIEAKEQAEELREHEEELRQNLEEMQATQEDLREKMEENLRMQLSLEKEKALLDALMDNLPEYIYFKDRDCKFIRISQSMLKLFPVETLEEMVGKSDFDFQPREAAQRYYDDEQKIMNSKQGVFDDIAHEVMQNGLEQWVSTTKLPFYNEKGEVIGTFGITKDITKLKLLEIEAKEQAEELREHEEELRQNLEELQSIQDEMANKAQMHEKEIEHCRQREKELLLEINALKQKLR